LEWLMSREFGCWSLDKKAEKPRRRIACQGFL